MELGRPNLEEFAATVLDLARQDRDLLILTSDSRGSGRLMPLANALPDQLIEIGIAEQDLVGIAAGLASAGKKVFAVSPASFLTARAWEQIKNDVAYSDHPVKLIGISAGVSYGALGSTHHSLHDFAALRAIHNLAIVAPADNFETREAIRAAVNYPHPIYVRFGKKPMQHLHTLDTRFGIGQAIPLSTGSDVTFIATGETVACAVQARELLERQGMSCGVISMHTLKPLDNDALLDAAQHSAALITVEEHSIYGGLGEACAAVLLQHHVHPAFKIVGIPDEYTVTGSQSEILEHYGISPHGLADTARQLLRSPQVAVQKRHSA
ncbi:MAG TPA: transketolase C-terminal domain-containing protein [Aggregatilineaceae bacterium]|nr:transketolase C-terminal domain-containing protein [Aggregatilineaceae bacterium]